MLGISGVYTVSSADNSVNENIKKQLRQKPTCRTDSVYKPTQENMAVF
jgi:hypothetical protein